jgi:hypothetical protein
MPIEMPLLNPMITSCHLTAAAVQSADVPEETSTAPAPVPSSTASLGLSTAEIAALGRAGRRNVCRSRYHLGAPLLPARRSEACQDARPIPVG